jgi:hypothetical protein
MAQTWRDVGFLVSWQCKANPDIWLRTATKLNGFKIHEDLLCDVDDCIFKVWINRVFIDYFYHMQVEGLVCKEQKTYLGAEIYLHVLASGGRLLLIHMSATQWKNSSKQLEKKVVSPSASGCRAELGASPELDKKQTSFYASLMGVFQ